MFAVQRHKFTKALRLSHGTIKCFPSVYSTPPHSYRPIYSSSLYLVHYSPQIKKILQDIPEDKGRNLKNGVRITTKHGWDVESTP